MAFDTLSTATAIADLLGSISGISTVQFGAPLAIGPKVSAYITIGQQPSDVKTQGTTWRDAHYFVDLCYRVDDAESDAETSLMAALDAIQAAVYADKTLGGIVSNTTIDTGMADEPEYRIRAGREFREYPIVLICRQYGTYEVNP